MRSLFEVTKKYSHYNHLTVRPSYQQKNHYSCGYFTAKAIINSLGNGYDKNLVKALKLTKDGVRQNHLIRTLRSRGVSASIYYDLTLPRMKHFLNDGKYIVVYDHRMDHWLVLGKATGHTLHFYDPEDRWGEIEYEYVEGNLNSFGIVCGRK